MLMDSLKNEMVETLKRAAWAFDKEDVGIVANELEHAERLRICMESFRIRVRQREFIDELAAQKRAEEPRS